MSRWSTHRASSITRGPHPTTPSPTACLDGFLTANRASSITHRLESRVHHLTSRLDGFPHRASSITQQRRSRARSCSRCLDGFLTEQVHSTKPRMVCGRRSSRWVYSPSKFYHARFERLPGSHSGRLDGLLTEQVRSPDSLEAVRAANGLSRWFPHRASSITTRGRRGLPSPLVVSVVSSPSKFDHTISFSRR